MDRQRADGHGGSVARLESNEVIGMGVDQKTAEFDQRFSKWGSATDAFKFWAENAVKVIDSYHGVKR